VDQDRGEVVQKGSLAPAPFSMGSWPEREWGTRVEAVLSGGAHVERPRAVAAPLAAEDGVDAAVAAIEGIATGRLPGSGRSG
jgi:hypothetical protein